MESIVGTRVPLGRWAQSDRPVSFDSDLIAEAVRLPREQVHVIGASDGRIGLAFGGSIERSLRRSGLVALASLPPIHPEWLGGRDFLAAHRVRFPYVAGEMAHGIASARMVVAVARAEMLGFFGAAGLPLSEIEDALAAIVRALGDSDAAPSWGANLIHMPHDPALEERVVDLYLRWGVRRMSASAFMQLTPSVVRYACTGLALRDGRITRRHHLFAKVSRTEVARPFMAPAPPAIVRALVERGALTPLEASLAERVPLAEDVTVEADSGGHTDNRPLTTVVPQMLALRDELVGRHGYDRSIRIGAAGGIGTPHAVSAGFALGASYVLTGSINQCTVESGMSEAGKEMLAAASPTDVVMAPSPDMFELGVKVQVLKRGTLFAARASRLYALYSTYGGLDELPADVRVSLEQEVFRMPLADAWNETRAFWHERDPVEVERAERDPKHRMALVFRSYVGQASRWAISGRADRRTDYQLWCGPALGAFNHWVRGSCLEPLAQRGVVQIALNLLEGAASLGRAQQLRSAGITVPARAFTFVPCTIVAGELKGESRVHLLS